MNWKETFYTGKREHPQEEKPASLTALLMPSLLGVAICLVCLCSLTWAWFTATQNSGVQPIQSATATVTAKLGETVLGELKVGEPCSLNGTGTLTLHMEGDAQYAYVVIKVGGTEYHTGYLTANKDYTITVNESGAALTLCWGKQDSLPGTAVEDGGSIGTAQQEPSDTPDEQPAVNGDSQQTPDTTVPANGDANTGDQSGSNETPGSENGGSTGNGSGEQGSDSGTGSDTGAGGSTGGGAGTGDTSNGTDGTTGE